MKRVDSHQDAASLLLGMSAGAPSAPDGAHHDEAELPIAIASAVVTAPNVGDGVPGDGWSEARGRGGANEPVCTPAAVAAALMSALPLPPGEPPGPTPGAGPPDRGLEHAWSNKQRRMQVSALPRKEWSAEEDALIRNGVEQLGCRWRVIAAQLPGRSDDAVRNRWSRLQESLRGSGEGLGPAGGSRRVSKEGVNGGEDSPRGGAGDDANGGTPLGGATNGGGGLASSLGNSGQLKAGSEANGNGAEKGEEAAGGDGSGSAAAAGRGKAASGGRGGGDSSSGGAAGGIPKPSRSSGSKSRAARVSGEDGAGKKERTSWTRAEDDIIVRGVAELGHKWYEIARRLPGRTDHAIRNRWSRLQSIMGLQESLNVDATQRVLPPGMAQPPPLSHQHSSGSNHGGGVRGAADGLAGPSTIDYARVPAARLSSAGGAPIASPLLRAAQIPPPLPGGGVAPSGQPPPSCLPSPSCSSLPPPPPPPNPPPCADSSGGGSGGTRKSVTSSCPCSATATSASVQTPLSIAALANVEWPDRGGGVASSQLTSTLPPRVSADTSRTSAYTSAGSEGSGSDGQVRSSPDAELQSGTAELLLLQSGGSLSGSAGTLSGSGTSICGSGGSVSCHPSPQISAANDRSVGSVPEIQDGTMGGGGCDTAAELLMLNKRPRVNDA